MEAEFNKAKAQAGSLALPSQKKKKRQEKQERRKQGEREGEKRKRERKKEGEREMDSGTSLRTQTKTCSVPGFLSINTVASPRLQQTPRGALGNPADRFPSSKVPRLSHRSAPVGLK